MEEVQKKQAISLSEVKEILGKVDVEEMQRMQMAKILQLLPFDLSFSKSLPISIICSPSGTSPL
jgi:hypothetical protein